jgi:hypothetical protein
MRNLRVTESVDHFMVENKCARDLMISVKPKDKRRKMIDFMVVKGDKFIISTKDIDVTQMYFRWVE